MRRLGAALLFAGCLQVPGDVLYRCESDGTCAQPGHVCGADGLCRLAPLGGGSGGSGGGATSGGANAGGAAAGGVAGGATAGGGAAGGSACVPAVACPTGPSACGTLDSGCGFELDCWPDSGTRACPGITFCGAGVRANLCSGAVSCVDGWCWENPLPQGNTLNAVWASGASDVWAVGEVGTLLHFNGQYWKTQPTPTRLDLFALHGTGAGDVWAVGEGGVVLHYDGVSWSIDHVSDAGLALFAVSALPSGEVFAGGAQGQVHVRSAAGAWSNASTGVLTEVRALKAFAANDVYAGGTGATSHAARWNGASWSALMTPGATRIDSLFGSSSAALVSGGAGCNLSLLSGSAFMPIAAAAACNTTAKGLAGTGTADLFIVGDDAIWHFDGGSAEPYAAGTVTKWLGAAALDAGVAVVAGINGGLARASLEASLLRQSSGALFDFTGVTAIDRGATNVLAATSDPGKVYQRSFMSTVGRWAPLSGMAGPSMLNALWAATDGGASGLLVYTGSDSVAGVNRPLNNFSISTTLPPQYAVTRHAGYVHFGTADGGHFRVVAGQTFPGLQLRFLPISAQRDTVRGLFSNGNELFGVTEQGALIWGDGDVWPGITPLGWPWPMRAVHGTPFDVGEPLIVAVGHDGGVFMGSPDGSVRFVDAGTREHLNGVFMADSTRGYVVGARGAALRWNGASWVSIAAPTHEDLLSVSGVPDGGTWAVGKSGTVLFRPSP